MAKRIKVSDLRPADRKAASVGYNCACKCPCINRVIGVSAVCPSCSPTCPR